uniref:DUF4408 domain-containing protein n=1 Tax=Aegilops tauschii TaxID=37682 RepID=M8CTK6_AEGTA
MAPEFGWWPMSPWLSPGAASFIFFNVLVGAIAVMSSSRGRGQEPATRRKLVRTASTVVLENLRSISNFPFHSLGDYDVAAYSAPAASQLHHVQDQEYTFREQEVREKAKGRGAYGCGRGTEEVDARAEQFIRQFREELKLERINSILNHTHALRRTAGAR